MTYSPSRADLVDFCRVVERACANSIAGAFWIGNAREEDLRAARAAGLVWRCKDSDGGYYSLTDAGEALLAEPVAAPPPAELPGFAILSSEPAESGRRSVSDAARVVLLADQGGPEVSVRVVAAGQTPVGFVRSVRRCDWYPDTREGRKAFAATVRQLWGGR